MEQNSFDVSKEQVMELIGQRGFTLVDILGKASYEDSHIKGAISVPFDELEDHGWEILGGRKVITYCHGPSCEASEIAARILRDHGIEAYAYRGGLEEWTDSDLPLEGKYSEQG
ncbi:MAG: rhodanese-like domain-containing protein [Candidatus Thermoplasmatota archaeon]|nr:rhodanese-like domain-containing protein [Candidatus Thermoplasmatota archaeon]